MLSIESLGYPLAYKAKFDRAWPGNGTTIRVEGRALEGMQKEALVYDTPTQTVWRMVSDEGPYLNGTDLAPFPLAYYTAGMAFSFVAELLKGAEAAGIDLQHVELTQDNFYTMQGSALRGDMIGGALPAELTATLEADADDAQFQALIDRTAKASPGQAYNRAVLQNVFALTHNNENIEVSRVAASPLLKADPQANFAQSTPQEANPRGDLVIKLTSAEKLFDVDGGAGSSLKSEQKRTLHVRGVVTQRDDGLLECQVQLFKPIGSTFRFLCDHQQGVAAPTPLAYLSAGIGFCFMTQIGRYATITKQNLTAYRIVQDNDFMLDGDQSTAAPVDTHLFLELDEPAANAQTILSMSEQTCFLHAAMRNAVPSVFKVLRTDAVLRTADKK